MGQLNEVDEDNNIIGDVPFLGFTFTKQSSLVDKVRAVLTWILTFVVLAFAVYGLYRLYKWYGNLDHRQQSQSSSSKSLAKASTSRSSFGFKMFADEEAGTARSETRSQSASGTSSFISKIVNRNRSVTPPPAPTKKTFGQKVKGFFGIGKKKERSAGK